jgi:hypothetical protein
MIRQDADAGIVHGCVTVSFHQVFVTCVNNFNRRDFLHRCLFGEISRQRTTSGHLGNSCVHFFCIMAMTCSITTQSGEGTLHLELNTLRLTRLGFMETALII